MDLIQQLRAAFDIPRGTFTSDLLGVDQTGFMAGIFLFGIATAVFFLVGYEPLRNALHATKKVAA